MSKQSGQWRVELTSRPLSLWGCCAHKSNRDANAQCEPEPSSFCGFAAMYGVARLSHRVSFSDTGVPG
jgi:hypothetical protein